MLEVIGLAIKEVLWYPSRFIAFITQSSNVLAQLRIVFLLGVAVSIIFVVIKIIKRIVWGN